MMKVLIALDDSDSSVTAAREAVRLFRSTGADFLVVNVAPMSTPWAGGFGFGAVGPLAVDPRWIDAGATDAEGEGAEEDRLALQVRAVEAGIPADEAEVRLGDAVAEINASAEEHDVDVIVVGSHDKSALRRLFDPSVASGVVRSAVRPVLVVRSD